MRACDCNVYTSTLLTSPSPFALFPPQPAVSPLIKKVGSSSSASSGTPTTRPHLRKGSTDSDIRSMPASPMLRRSTDYIGSSPDVRAKTPGRTGIPTPTQHLPRTGATPRENRTRAITPSSGARRVPRAKSTDPRGAYSTYRPSSAKSDYVPGYYMNGQDSLMSKYAMGRLTQLNFGDEDCECSVQAHIRTQTHRQRFMHTSHMHTIVATHSSGRYSCNDPLGGDTDIFTSFVHTYVRMYGVRSLPWDEDDLLQWRCIVA